MLCDHRRQQHCWFGCRVGSDVSLSIFYHGFCYGKLDEQPVEDEQRRAFAAVKVIAKVGSSKSSTNDFIRVSPNLSVTDVTKTPHS